VDESGAVSRPGREGSTAAWEKTNRKAHTAGCEQGGGTTPDDETEAREQRAIGRRRAAEGVVPADPGGSEDCGRGAARPTTRQQRPCSGRQHTARRAGHRGPVCRRRGRGARRRTPTRSEATRAPSPTSRTRAGPRTVKRIRQSSRADQAARPPPRPGPNPNPAARACCRRRPGRHALRGDGAQVCELRGWWTGSMLTSTSGAVALLARIRMPPIL